MNGNSILADTNALIYLYEGNQTVSNFLNGKIVFISFITEIELLSKPGLSTAQLNLLKAFLNDFNIFDINTTIKENTSIIRREHKLKLPDAIIAATAKFLSIPLVTADGNFKKVKNVSVFIIDP